MQDEEKAYKEFFVKAIHAGQEFANDFSKLSPHNQTRFWQDMSKSAEAKAIFEFCRCILNQR